MKIDIEKAKKEFIKYTEEYDLTNVNIKGKQEHTLRVVDNSIMIAKNLNLSQEEINLAALIGLLHDIARFEQYKQYQTFHDVYSFDHGDYGVKVLETDMRRYVDTDEYDEIIKKAIKNHNKFAIEEGLTEKEKLFARIIRDADKLDVIADSVIFFWKGQEDLVNKSIIDLDLYNQFLGKATIKREKGKKYDYVNHVLTIIGFIFDINFKESYEIIKEKDYINKILDRYNFEDETTRKCMDNVRSLANRFIEEKVNQA